MRVSHSFSADFDDSNLVSTAGLLPVMALAQEAGLPKVITDHLTAPGGGRTREDPRFGGGHGRRGRQFPAEFAARVPRGTNAHCPACPAIPMARRMPRAIGISANDVYVSAPATPEDI